MTPIIAGLIGGGVCTLLCLPCAALVFWLLTDDDRPEEGNPLNEE